MTRRNTYVCERSSDRYSAIQNGKDNRYSSTFLAYKFGYKSWGIEKKQVMQLINTIMKHGVKYVKSNCVFSSIFHHSFYVSDEVYN